MEVGTPVVNARDTSAGRVWEGILEDNICPDDGDGCRVYNVFFENLALVDFDDVGFVGVGVLLGVCTDVDYDNACDDGC